MLLRAPAAVDRRNDHDRLLTWLLLGILLAGAVLRLYGLDRTSIWNDEAASWSIARQPFRDMMQATAADNHPPLYNIILYATIRLLGDSSNALRLPSALMGIANIYLLYRLATVLWDRLTGVFAAALLAAAGFHIWYSQEARMYALLCLTATAFALTTALFLDRPSRLRAALCGLAGAALLYSHIYGALNWAAINLVAALVLVAGGGWSGADRRRWIASQGFAVLAFLPWVFVLLERTHEVMKGFWLPFPTMHFLYWTMRAIAGGIPMLCVLLLLGLIALLAPADHAPANAPVGFGGAWRKLLPLSWGVLPLLGGYAVSVVSQPILEDRYLIGSLPPLLLLAARGVWMLRSNRLVLAGAIALLAVCGAPAIYRSVASDQREDLRALIVPFSERFQGSDGVVFSSAGISNTFHYYFHQPVAFESVVFHPESDPVAWPGVTRVWVFVRDGIDMITAPLLNRVEALYQRRQTFRAYGMTLYLYMKPRSPDPASSPAGTDGSDGQPAPPRTE